ncbi:MAG TPA: hypothetical protein VHO72_05265 [Bacteroidales bacterium]|nr:hypothetical protein [Bacteroidales bacterium]
MEALPIPNLLLIAGTGQNVGKTTLACRIIERFSAEHPIVGIKISSHFHKKIESGNIIVQRSDLYVAEEIDRSKTKDSSLFLAAGAVKSYFVMAADHQLPEAMQIIKDLSLSNASFVCESGGLRNWYIPGVFLMMHRLGSEMLKQDTPKWKAVCDRWITFDGAGLDFNLDDLSIQDNNWHLKV